MGYRNVKQVVFTVGAMVALSSAVDRADISSPQDKERRDEPKAVEKTSMLVTLYSDGVAPQRRAPLDSFDVAVDMKRFPYFVEPLIEPVLTDYHRICYAVLRAPSIFCHPNIITEALVVDRLSRFSDDHFVGQTVQNNCDLRRCAQIEIRSGLDLKSPWGRYLILHEIGHAYGLRHADAKDAPVMEALLPWPNTMTEDLYNQGLKDMARLLIKRHNVWNVMGPALLYD